MSINKTKIAVVMGSVSDWETMSCACDTLQKFSVPFIKKVISAHRTPNSLASFAKNAHKNSLKVIIAGAGGAAHLPGMLAANTTVPVLGVPVASHHLKGLDSLYSIVQMPSGIPVATFAIGKAGAVNAALFAIATLAVDDEILQKKLKKFRQEQSEKSKKSSLP
jgi:5-(carboxyamino)imidazole ribonucleotide mutase